MLVPYAEKAERLKAKLRENKDRGKKTAVRKAVLDTDPEPLDYLTVRQASMAYWERREAQKKRAEERGNRLMTIADILQEFAERSKNKHKRIALLRQMATIVVKEVSVDELSRKRANFNEHKDFLFPIESESWCWSCGKKRPTERHHVILLKNGGPELTKANVVFLCDTCHATIHPWLFSTSLAETEIGRLISIVQDAKEGKISRNQVEIEVSSILDSVFAQN